MTAPLFATFGCRLNAYESEVMRGHAQRAGLRDVIIVNTCAVTAEAERQARQAIRRARRRAPDARIVVTGCAAQISPDTYAAMPEVDAVLGNAEKLEPESWALLGAADTPRVRVNDIMAVRETASHMIGGFEGRARAFVQIQQGCDHRCTFCIIPFGRGPSRSVPMGAVVAEARGLVEAGYLELVLTGVDITDYGRDLPGAPRLGQLVRRLLARIPALARLRLSSLDPVEIDDELIALYGTEPRLLPYVHLSLQAGDDMILKRMKRRHSRDDALGVCARLRESRPDMVFGADLIAGFPTETEAMFDNTLALIDEIDVALPHVFPYSARPGTPAARMPQLPGPVRKERAARLRARGASRLHRTLEARRGTSADVLVEQGRNGRTEHYLPVRLDADAPAGRVVSARITGRDGDALTGTVAP